MCDASELLYMYRSYAPASRLRNADKVVPLFLLFCICTVLTGAPLPPTAFNEAMLCKFSAGRLELLWVYVGATALERRSIRQGCGHPWQPRRSDNGHAHRPDHGRDSRYWIVSCSSVSDLSGDSAVEGTDLCGRIESRRPRSTLSPKPEPETLLIIQT